MRNISIEDTKIQNFVESLGSFLKVTLVESSNYSPNTINVCGGNANINTIVTIEQSLSTFTYNVSVVRADWNEPCNNVRKGSFESDIDAMEYIEMLNNKIGGTK